MNLVWIAAAWLAYAALHSLLASLAVKQWLARRWPGLVPGYRLAFNGIATLALLPVLGLVYGTDSAWLWRWTGAAAWCANGLAAAALAAVFWAARGYDMDEFIGLRQWRQGDRATDDGEAFIISPMHRLVRHPWYFGSLVLVWTRDMNGPLLVSALAITLYFIVGSRLEERKLMVLHGDVYRRYCQCVAGLVPLPWKVLGPKQMAELTAAGPHR
jgi:protein-S-isoprenylcysteine O-methyltransferase Ste14